MLDTATLFIGNMTTATAASIAMTYVWTVHNRDAAVRYWTLGFLAEVIATVVLAFRSEMPLLFSIIVGNLFSVGCNTLLLVGTARFLGRKVNWPLLLSVYIPAAVAVIYWSVWYDSIIQRNFAYTAASGITWLLMFRDLWFTEPGPQRKVYRFVAICWAFMMAASAIRAVDLMQRNPTELLAPGGFVYVSWFIVVQMVIILTCAGYLLMTSQRLQLRLDELASKDELTGAFNRRVLQMQAETLARKGGACVLVMDLDHFKSINDNHGHAAGDAVLREFVAAIRPLLRKTDLLTRAGGEEFWVLLPDTPLTQGAQIAEQLRQRTAAQPMAADQHRIALTVSIGVAELRSNLEDALLHADQALYRAKERGRNRVEVANPA